MNTQTLGKDYLTIKDFAGLVDMTTAALRHYDNKGIFQPSKSGAEAGNKYRYYSPTQITTVKLIRVLSEIGVPLQTIRELTESRTPEKMLKLLSRERDIIAEKLRFMTDVHLVINTFLDLINAGMCATETDISVCEIPEKQIILGDVNNFDGSVGFFREFTGFCNANHVPKLNLSYPIGGFFENMEVFLKAPSQPTRFFSLDPKGYETRAAGRYLVGYTRGYYGQTNGLPGRMAAFAKKNGLRFSGPVYNIYLFDEISEINPEKYLLQVAASVTETRRISPRHLRTQP